MQHQFDIFFRQEVVYGLFPRHNPTGNLTAITTPSGPENNGNEGVFYTTKCSRAGTSPSNDVSRHIQGTTFI